MATYEIIVTDVTRFGDGYFCVAGWDRLSNRMIRPEPPEATVANAISRFWQSDFVGHNKIFWVGNVVKLEAGPPPNNFPMPHATEDRIVTAGSTLEVLARLTNANLVQAVAGSISPNLSAVFAQGLQRPVPSTKSYVPAGFAGPSLGAISCAKNQLSFFEDTYNANNPKLRVKITSALLSYDLPVTSQALKLSHKTSGLAALKARVTSSNGMHIRLGLARPFAAIPDKCYAQVNGVVFL